MPLNMSYQAGMNAQVESILLQISNLRFDVGSELPLFPITFFWGRAEN